MVIHNGYETQCTLDQTFQLRQRFPKLNNNAIANIVILRSPIHLSKLKQL